MITWQFVLKTFLLCYVLTSVIQSTSAKLPEPPWIDMDYRVAFVDELIAQRKARVFYDTKIQNYTAFIIGNNGRRISVIGAKNSLLLLEGETLRKLRQRLVGENQIAQIQRTCTNCKLDVYISFMKTIPNRPNLLILCLSYVFEHSRFREKDDKPNCEIVHANRDLNGWIATFESSGFAPYNPLSENTALDVKAAKGGKHYLYVGATITNKGDYRIVKRPYPEFNGLVSTKGNLETPKGDTRYFYGRTDFVSSFQTKDAAFFLFREKSKEEEECCQHNTRVTRLARICKADPGGVGSRYPSKDNFITFQKASLICPTPGPHEFRFKEARSAHWDEKSRMLYTVFTTTETAPAGSAICLYDFAAFNHAFDEPLKKENKGTRSRRKRTNSCAAWNNHPTPRQRQLGKRTQYPYSLMALAIHPQRGHAIVTQFNERWSQMALDRPALPPSEKRNIVVLFIATDRGSILKLAIVTPTRSCRIEEFRFRDSNERVNKMQLYDIENRQRNAKVRSLLITTNKRVLKLPLERCQRFKTEKDCIESRDPYCGWDPHDEECATFNRDQTIWRQDLSACPNTRHPSNLRWSHWSPWESCPSVNTRQTHKKLASKKLSCKCRYKKCLHPEICAEEEEGEEYKNIHMQVTNCTKVYESGWAAWSSWSPCSVTCGEGSQLRQRVCKNQKNSYERARYCPSKEESETKICQQLPCTATPQTIGGWSSWSQWSSCSNRCGKGFRNRSRVCISSSPPRVAGCFGDSQQWTPCEVNKCQVVMKTSAWTQWLRDDEIKRGYLKKRFQFVCAATVAHPKRVQSLKIITEEQFCRKDMGPCDRVSTSRIFVDQNGGWSEWTAWSACTKPCDTGLQERTRACDNPYPSGNGQHCVGNDRESRLCNTSPCQMWSCWSEWGSCEPNCSQKRTRQCRVKYSSCEEGQSEDKRFCTGGKCKESVYWTEWTQWSDCGSKGTRVRDRRCDTNKVCFGPSQEVKTCSYMGESSPSHKGRFGLIHLVLSNIICFILGSILSAVIVACLLRSCYERRRRSQRNRARSNTYVLRESSIPPSCSSTIQRPNNLRIVNDIHSELPTSRGDPNSRAPLLPPRRYDLSSDSSTITNRHHHSMNISPQSPPPLPPRLNSLPSRQHSLSAGYSLHKESGLSSL